MYGSYHIISSIRIDENLFSNSNINFISQHKLNNELNDELFNNYAKPNSPLMDIKLPITHCNIILCPYLTVQMGKFHQQTNHAWWPKNLTNRQIIY